MKKTIQKLWAWVKWLWLSLDKEIEKYVPAAINIVEGIKKVMDSPVDDIVLAIVKTAIPGTADDILIDKIKFLVEKNLPTILLNLKLINDIANIDNPNEQLKAILAELKFPNEQVAGAFYHSLASLILEKLSDGKLNWSECVLISEFYYKNVLKGK